MTYVKERYDSFNEWLDRGLKKYLPGWLYKQVTFQPDRAWKPRNYKVALAFNALLIAVAVVLFILSVALGW